MKPIKNRIQSIIGGFAPDGAKTAVMAALLSLLGVFALVITLCPSWYDALPNYSELITGVTTFSGYNKEADMRIVKVVLLGIPVLFFVFCGAKRFLCQVAGMDQKTLAVTVGWYVLWVISVINGQKGCSFLGMALLLFVVCYSILKWQKELSGEQLVSFGVGSLMAYVAMESAGILIFSFINQASAMNGSWIYEMPSVLACIWIVLSAVGVRREKVSVERQIAFWQVIIPVGILPMATFRYVYQTTGDAFLLFYSSRYKYFLYGVTAFFVLYGIYAFWRKKKGVYLTTVIATAMLRTFVMPEGILNMDFFHMGEMTTPFMQLQEYGKVPFFDLMPIHGLCDYYYSVIDFLFLDNTYLSMNGAMTIGNMILTAFFAAILYCFCQQKEGAYVLSYCFVPFFVNDAGIRYVFLFVSFFVLFASKIRQKALQYIWWYVLLSIVSIAWNMSIGGAGAAAFFPVVLFWYLPKAFRELRELFASGLRGRIRQCLLYYGVLFVIGIAYIPVFLQIVTYLRENTGTTLMANGMAMIEEFDCYREYFTPSLFGGEQISFLQVFGFLIPFLCCLIFAFDKFDRQEKRDGREYGVVFFLCFFIIANYAFVRFDSGLRTSVLSVFFFVAFLVGIQKWKRPEFLILTLLAVFMTGDAMKLQTHELVEEKKVESFVTTNIHGQEVDDPVVYVTGESVGMQRLGRGFIRGNTLQNLQNLKYVFESETGNKSEYLDLTNAVANYVFLDGEMVLPYTSGYNISNERMQRAAIEQLESTQVDFVILAPYIRFDEATFSLRSPLLYEYLYKAGYQPYVYENVIYMKRGGSVLFEKSNGFTDFANLMHKEALQMLPAVWGESDGGKALEELAIATERKVGEQKVTWFLQEEQKGEEIDFVKITIPEGRETESGAGKNGETEWYFSFDGDQHRFTFYGEGNVFLIPVYSSPFWKNQTCIDSFCVGTKAEGDERFHRIEEAEISFLRFRDK